MDAICNGFVKLTNGEWINLNVVVKFTVEDVDEWFILVHYMELDEIVTDSVSDGFLTKERALICLEQMIKHMEKN